MKLIHYSTRPGLKFVDPANMGQSGVPSQEMRQGVPDVKRSYWYMNGTTPEGIVTGSAHSVYRTELQPDQKIYDLSSDPDKIFPQLKAAAASRQINPGVVTSEEYLKAVKDKGYHGFTNSGHDSMKNVVALFHPQSVEAEEPIAQEHHGKAQLLHKAEDDVYNLGHHFIFTTENPAEPRKAHGHPEDVVDSLKEKGENASIVQGHYGQPEKSILVRNPKNVDLLHRLAHAHGQESAIESDGHNHKLYFYNGPKAGKYQQGSGTQWFDSAPDDFYTAMPDKEGKTVYFRHNIDEKDLHEGTHIHKPTKLSFEDPWDQAKHDRGGDEEHARYTDKRHFRKLQKDEQAPIHPDIAPYIQSLAGDQIDETSPSIKAHYGRSKQFVPAGPDEHPILLDKEPNDTITPEANLTDVFRAYKNSPHHPRSLALKYMVHRIENAGNYTNASPEQRDAMDADFMAHHQKGDAGKKNGGVDINALRLFVKNGHELASELVNHKNKLHEFIMKHSGHLVRNVNGQPSIALNRGLNTLEPGRDHALASYSDTHAPVIGSHPHYRWVPMNKVWYSYDVGPQGASSEDHGPEREFVVSPHEVVPATGYDVNQLVPRDRHMLAPMTPDEFTTFKLRRSDRMPPEEISNFVNRNKNVSSSTMDHVLNHPDTPESVIRNFVDGMNGWESLEGFHQYGERPARPLPPDLLHKVVEHAIKHSPVDIYSLSTAQGKNMSPETKKLVLNYVNGKSHFSANHREKITQALNAQPLAASEKLIKAEPEAKDYHDHLISFIHPHDRHALQATLVTHGYPVDDKEELLNHLKEIATTAHGRIRLDNSLNNLDNIRKQAYSSGADQANAFDKYLKHAKSFDLNRMRRSWDQIRKESDRPLSKAVREKDFSPIEDAWTGLSARSPNSKEFGVTDFNAAKHVYERAGHDPYIEMMNSPKEVKSIADDVQGISPKMIHKVGKDKYMAKPYHSNYSQNDVESIKHNSPGWATLTTKDLYDSAGMGHLGEDVRGGIHKGIPMTLHRFSLGFKDVDAALPQGTDNRPDYVRQEDLARIAVMDFLTNNVDRHQGNLLMGDFDEDGFKPVKAIDHELAFGYGETPHGHEENPEFSDSLWNYAHGSSGIKRAGAETTASGLINSSGTVPDYFKQATPYLKDWWGEHRDNVRKTFLQSLRHVSNEDLKAHLRGNFMQRMNHMDDLVQKVPNNDTLFSKRHGGINVTKPGWAVS